MSESIGLEAHHLPQLSKCAQSICRQWPSGATTCLSRVCCDAIVLAACGQLASEYLCRTTVKCPKFSTLNPQLIPSHFKFTLSPTLHNLLSLFHYCYFHFWPFHSISQHTPTDAIPTSYLRHLHQLIDSASLYFSFSITSHLLSLPPLIQFPLRFKLSAAPHFNYSHLSSHLLSTLLYPTLNYLMHVII